MIDKVEIKHLAPYLHFKLNGIEYLGGEIFTLVSVDLTKKNELIWESKSGISRRVDCKPVVRPQVDIYNEIKHNGEKFVPIDVLARMVAGVIDFSDDWETAIIELSAIEVEQWPYFLVEKLYEWWFDVKGLIPAGLAIDINSLKH